MECLNVDPDNNCVLLIYLHTVIWVLVCLVLYIFFVCAFGDTPFQKVYQALFVRDVFECCYDAVMPNRVMKNVCNDIHHAWLFMLW